MAIKLRVHVRDHSHRDVRSFDDEDDEPFFRFCRAASARGVRYVDFIGPYVDSMLNYHQLRAWIEDFPRVIEDETVDPRFREAGLLVLDAANEATELAGYLYLEC